MKRRMVGGMLPILLLFSCSMKPETPLRDPIPPLHLVAGVADTLVVSDLFFAGDAVPQFLPHATIAIHFDPALNIVVMRADSTFEGLTLLRFRLRGRKYALPIFVEKWSPQTFRLHPQSPPHRITVMGSFNNWNRNANSLQDSDGDGEYTCTILLPPGRYEYKFVVDGEEIIDPENSEKVSNPFGSYNSILVVPPRHPGRRHLHLLHAENGSDSLHVEFHLEAPDTTPPRRQEVVALLDNHPLTPSRFSVDGRNLRISLPIRRLEGTHTLRVAVTRDGAATLFQTLHLADGAPFGNENHDFHWCDAVLYSILIDRFADGAPDNNAPIPEPELSPKANYQGGDLQGILQKIEEGYFDSLGVSVLWLSPAIDNTEKAHREWPPPHRYFSGYHGYWPVHPRRVEEHFGDLSLLRRVVDAAHAHGMKVLLDFIANHVHIDHPYFRNHRDWFGTMDLPDGRKNIRLWDEFRLTTWFEPFLPSFDYIGSEAAVDTMTEDALWWLEQTGADGFRHDAVKHIPYRFWRRLTAKLKRRMGDRKIFQIGETFGGYRLVHSYVNPGQLDAQFNFNLFYTARYVFLTPKVSFDVLRQELDKTFSEYGMHNLMGNIMDSHDQVRYMALADGDLRLDSPDAAEVGWRNPPEVDHPGSYRKAQLYLAYLLTIPGVPTLYYGDEIGMTGAADPDNRRMMRFGAALSPPERDMLRFTRKWIHLRRAHAALRYGDFYPLLADTAVFAFVRSTVGERLLVVLNKSSKEARIRLQFPAYYEVQSVTHLFTGRKLSCADSRLDLRLPPVSAQPFKLNSAPESADHEKVNDGRHR